MKAALAFLLMLAMSALFFFLAFNKRARMWLMRHSYDWDHMKDEEKEAAEALHTGGLMMFGIVLIGFAVVVLIVTLFL